MPAPLNQETCLLPFWEKHGRISWTVSFHPLYPLFVPYLLRHILPGLFLDGAVSVSALTSTLPLLSFFQGVSLFLWLYSDAPLTKEAASFFPDILHSQQGTWQWQVRAFLTIFKLLNFRSFSFIWVLVGAGGISLSASLHLPLSLSLSSSPPLSLYLFCVCIRAGLACLTIWKSYWKLSDRPIDIRFLWSVWYLMEGSSCQFCVFFLGGTINFCPWCFTDTEYFFSFFTNANL